MKALVTGGAGFIGSHVARALLARGEEVRVLHLPGDNLINLRGLDVERVEGDVRDKAGVQRAVEGCDAVFHLAAIYALWLPRPALMEEVNIDGTRNVLQAAMDEGVRRVVYTSSIAVYGGQGPFTDATEQSPFRLGATGERYARSKHEAHKVALSFVDRGLDLTICAPCGPIGPGDYGPTPTGRLLLTAATLPIPLIVETSMCFGDVRDMAEGHVLAWDKGRTGQSYLLGHRNVRLSSLAKIAMDVLERDRPVIPAPKRLASVIGRGLLAYANRVSRKAPLFTPETVRIARMGLRADCTRAREELGLPQTPIETSVRDALVWFAKEGYVDDRRVARRLRDLA